MFRFFSCSVLLRRQCVML